MAKFYDKVVSVLQKPSQERYNDEIQYLEPWFRKKSKLFECLESETLFDVIKHCQMSFKTKNEIVVYQGEKGNSFFIIIRGSVSVYIKEGGDEQYQFENKETDRKKLGTPITTFGEGHTFGELALVRDDCTRTASIITDQDTDIIVIPKELYHRSVAKVVRLDYDLKVDFLEKYPLFADWPLKWKKTLALSLMKQDLKYDDALFKQGDDANRMFFVISGEIRLTCEPEGHKILFRELIESCYPCFLGEKETICKGSPRAEKKMKQEENTVGNLYSEDYQDSWYSWRMTPSEIRKKNMRAKSNSEKHHICVMGVGQLLGDSEFLLNLGQYFATAKCTRDTSVYWIHRDHFIRLFRKKNPQTIKPLAKTLALLMQSRSSREALVKKVPLLKCIIWKLHEICGGMKRKRTKDEESSLSQLPDAETTGHSSGSRPKSIHSNKSCPITRGDSAHYSVSSFRSSQLPVISDNTTFTRSSGFTSTTTGGSGLIYSMPNLHTKKMNEEKAKAGYSTERHPMNRGDGIFMKLMQISNPNLNRKHLDIDDEELEYLVSLRRRMARKLEDFHPYSNMDRLCADDSGRKRSCQKSRGRSEPKRDSGTVLPAVKGGKQTMTSSSQARSLSTAKSATSAKKKKQRGITFKIE